LEMGSRELFVSQVARITGRATSSSGDTFLASYECRLPWVPMPASHSVGNI
jgi:hypothetical protein